MFSLIRPYNCIFAGIGVLIGGLIGLEGIPNANIIFAILAAGIINGAGNTVNDYVDRKVDAINNPDRPIPAGLITPKKALITGTIFFGIGIVFAALTGKISCLLIAILNSSFLILYAKKLKWKGLAGNLTIGYLVGSTFLFGGFAVGNIKTVSILAAMAGFSTVGRELIKDIEDIHGDEKSGSHSFPVKFGRKKAALAAIIFTLIAIFLIPIPYWLNFFGKLYLIPVSISVIVFFIGMFIIGKNQDKEHANQASLMYKIAMGIGLLAFLIGALI
ncbi:hypothetical protein AKJ49_02250 [candidate division MSBL1 archaeon SCGC-AAA382A03]|uniref:Digeranylgeranylglyceryl phosphate synthase n=1 Tax=candidate division MSBL1 archaeon SCGC-AAA382A03 TaxID=1698278 RepID=A0A133VCW6_9EURY|nr:hypothetical protein AKJ49_02250 [candidate division MSBL1 archaeon SCGC-AAA382A03]